MSKYVCSKSKDEILEIIVDHFETIHKELYECHSDENNARYTAIIELLAKLEIYENTSEEE